MTSKSFKDDSIAEVSQSPVAIAQNSITWGSFESSCYADEDGPLRFHGLRCLISFQLLPIVPLLLKLSHGILFAEFFGWTKMAKKAGSEKGQVLSLPSHFQHTATRITRGVE